MAFGKAADSCCLWDGNGMIIIFLHIEQQFFDIVNIGLHFFLKNVRPYAASCNES